MPVPTRGLSVLRNSLLGLLLLLGSAVAYAGDGDGCQSSKDHGFICGPVNAEDLVLVPGTKWIISSGMAPGASMYLVDTRSRNWKDLYPADAPRARQDMSRYGACPGSPDPNNFISHGLNLQPGENGHSTLYVVGHGEREAIEVFDVNTNGTQPELTWKGCVLTPDGMAANSVASLSDGSLLATIPLHHGKTIPDAFNGELTGGVYRWSPGDTGFNIVQGTELPYANGIEVSANGKEFYVVSSGALTVTAYSNTNPARQLRVTGTLPFIPDNLHMADDGRLITAGLITDFPDCDTGEGFDLAQFASCPRPYIVSAIDPASMKVTNLAEGGVNKHFSNITMAVIVGDEVWTGTFAGDRIGFQALK